MNASEAKELTNLVIFKRQSIIDDIHRQIESEIKFGSYSTTVETTFVDVGSIAEHFCKLGYKVDCRFPELTLRWD